MEEIRILTPENVRELGEKYPTPFFVYSQKEIEDRCREALAFPNAFGLTVRYAMKANPNAALLKIVRNSGIHIDASSEHEVERAIRAGFKAEEIMLTSQQLPRRLKEIVENGTMFNACSLRQLEEFGKLFPGRELCIRFNPGLGSGATKKTDVGGVTSSFGIWHEAMDQVMELVRRYRLKVVKVHTHIGSGSDPEVWKAVAYYSMEIAGKFDDCATLNLGGGFKVGRMKDEKSVDLQKIGQPVRDLFADFAEKTGRKMKLEIEPGTYLMANSGVLVSRVDDVVSTGDKGMVFVKLDSGMDSNTRPSLYGARHPMTVVAADVSERKNGECVVVGHCCESGDVFTQHEGGEPYAIPLAIPRANDYMVLGGAGAYCSSMSTKNYNSYPEAGEILMDTNGKFHQIRKRQTMEQLLQNETAIS